VPYNRKRHLRNQPRRAREDMNQPRPHPPRWQHNPKFPRQNEQELTRMLLPPLVQIFVVITAAYAFGNINSRALSRSYRLFINTSDMIARPRNLLLFPHRPPYHTRSATTQGEKNKEKETPGMSSKEPHRLRGQPSHPCLDPPESLQCFYQTYEGPRFQMSII